MTQYIPYENVKPIIDLIEKAKGKGAKFMSVMNSEEIIGKFKISSIDKFIDRIDGDEEEIVVNFYDESKEYLGFISLLPYEVEDSILYNCSEFMLD